MRAGLILVAGGQSLRFGDSVKKQFFELAGEALFVHTLRKFTPFDEIVERVLVLPEVDLPAVKERFASALRELKVSKFASGGRERVYSVINGFAVLSADIDYVIIHDAVRPFISRAIIRETLAKAEKTGAAIVAVKVRDTLKKVDKNCEISETIDRSKIYAAQTPQIFERTLFQKALENFYRAGEPEITDDAMLVEMLDRKIAIVEGGFLNIKITTSEDVKLAQAIWHLTTPEKETK